MKYLLLFFILITLASCNKSEKSNDLLKKATEVYFISNLPENIKIDSSLILTKKAIEVDNENVNALQHLSILLFKNKDIDGLLEVSDRLINLRPERATFLLQKGIYLEIKGNSSESKKYLKKSISKYEEHLDKDSLNFDLNIEYIDALNINNDTILANKKLNNLKKMKLEEYQIEILDLYNNQKKSINDLFKYWKGEIDYNELSK